MDLYIRNDMSIPPVEFPRFCRWNGVDNLQELQDLRTGPVWSRCNYSLGSHFLLVLRETMGAEAWHAAMRAFYGKFGHEGLYVSAGGSAEDEDVYQVFIEHTPAHLVGAVQDVFVRLHGGPFVTAKN